MLVLQHRLQLDWFRLLPGEFTSSEMAVAAGGLVHWVFKVEVLDNATRSEAKVLLNNIVELFLGVFAGSIASDVHGHGVGKPNSVGYLHKSSSAETCFDKGFSYPSCGIGA